MGQFIAYRSALRVQEQERVLYLAIPRDVYSRFFVTPFIEDLVEQNQLYLLVYDIDQEVITRWRP